MGNGTVSIITFLLVFSVLFALVLIPFASDLGNSENLQRSSVESQRAGEETAGFEFDCNVNPLDFIVGDANFTGCRLVTPMTSYGNQEEIIPPWLFNIGFVLISSLIVIVIILLLRGVS